MRTGLRAVVRVWRRLTSMRTALILLFLLAVAAVPGSLLPQRTLNPDKTASYIASHGAWGRFLDAIDMFDVFGSPWFAAIYLLLFVSLIGCLIPRIRLHARAMARKPLPAPRNLDKLPESASFPVVESPADYASAARSALGRRWRIERRDEDGGVITLSAEKGYSRETGNLIFHVSLLVALVLIAIGRLYSYQGSIIVRQGTGFCDSVAKFDSWKPGRFAAEGKIAPAPFCITDLNKFTADYSASGEPLKFEANLTYTPTPASDSRPVDADLSVNHPLRIEGDRIYLIGHGFSPRFTISEPGQATQTSNPVFVPNNATTLQSEGVVKQQGPLGKNEDIGISGIFAPDPVLTDNVLTSKSPQAINPMVAIFVYKGNLNYNGQPQSIYTLDTSHMKKIGAANMSIGQTKTFAGGVTVRFDGWVPWVSIQVSHDPTQDYLLFAAAAMVIGLLASLGVRRRRLWLRLTPSSDPQDPSLTVVFVGGLARSDSGSFNTEFASLIERLRSAGRPAQEQLIPAGRE